MNALEKLINKLDLQPHPEGGFFKETYRSEELISQACLPNSFDGDRHYCTGIYYLLKSDDFSAFHKVNQDEMWHFYQGDAIELTMISKSGELSTILIGNDITNGEVPQFVVPKHFWFAAKVLKPNSYALAGCTVSPGFDFNDFTLAHRNDLIEKFPQHAEIIESLTRQ